MVALGFGVLFAGYSMIYTGIAWVKGWNLSILDIIGPVSYYKGTWPPPKDIPTAAVIPPGAKKTSTTAATA